MNDEDVLNELLTILEANNVHIRHEHLGGSGGGLCTLKGQHYFFVDSEAPSFEMAVLGAKALNITVDTEKIYLKPQVRQFLEDHGTD